MNNYNSSSYYRANPYKELGYMPPMALKNRRSPQHAGQLPQGQQYFEPSAKKHFQNSYKNQIQQDKIIGALDNLSPLQRQAMQRSYFRSLNSKDIQGASTNTLISKAVKNKMKAQQQLQRRREIEKQAEEIERQIKYQKQQERKRIVQNYHNQIVLDRQKLQRKEVYNTENSPKSYYNNSSYHNQGSTQERQRKNRQAELLKLAQQRKNYAIVDFNSLYNYHNRQKGESQPSNIQNAYEHIKQQPEYNKSKKNEQNNDLRQHENSKKIMQPGYLQKKSEENQYQYRFSKPSKDTPVYKYQDIKPQSSTEHRNIDNNYSIIQRDQMRKYQNYSLPDEKNYQKKQQKIQNYQRIQPILFKNHEIMKSQHSYEPINSYGQKYEQGRIYAQKTEPQAKYSALQKRSREQLRRMNPTFLSYGSPSFAVASKNVIGY